jgi:hypothetical protein
MRLLFTLSSWLIAILLYPLALLLVIAADTLVGDAEFARHLLLQSRRDLISVILTDWLSATLVALPLWFLLRGLSRLGCPRAAVVTAPLAVGILLVSLAFIPPYLPLIFGAILLWASGLNALFDALFRSARP